MSSRNMIDVEKHQASLIEKLSVKVAEASSTNQLADLIRGATCDARLFSYSEILTFPNIIMLAGTAQDSLLDVLRLFAFGTWHDYQRDVESYPTLIPNQVYKLKQMHLITLMRSCKELKVDLLMREFQLADEPELKRFLQFCRNSSSIRFERRRNKLVVNSSALDLLTKIQGKVIITGQSFDVFLQEAAAVQTDPSGLVSNGIVKEFRVPVDPQNNSISRAEFQTRSARLFGMLVQHATSAHSRNKSFGGKIYAGMFVVVGNELFLRSEAAPTKPLTADNSILDYGAVRTIFVDNTALKIHDGTVLRPLYCDDLLKHLECNSKVLALKHRICPMQKALDEGYTTFLRCHTTFDSTSARTAVSVHVRRHHKYSSKNDKAKFRSALRDTVLEYHVFDYTVHWLFVCLPLLTTYDPDPVGYFTLIRDWEVHVREHLTEVQKLTFTAPVRNFLIEIFFHDFFPKALYGILCFYEDANGSLDLKRWLQNLHRVSKTELVPTTTEWNRCSFGILHPLNNMTLEHLSDRFLLDMKKLDEKARDDSDGSPDHYALLKWRALNKLRDQNMAVYYKVLMDKIEEYAHIIHMPTVRMVTQSPSCIFQRPGVIHLSKEDTGHMKSMMHTCSVDQVDMIVVTDGSGLTTADDMGWESGTAVSGKVDLYVAASGMNPLKVIPVVIDVGTDNQRLLNDPLYRGLQVQRPKEDNDYFPVIEEFMNAVYARWGNVVVQFEYVPSSLGFKLLKHYKDTRPVFNDNIQAAVTIAGLLGAVRAKGRPMADFAKQKIVVAAADRSRPDLEVVNAAITTMQMIAGNNNTTFETARKQIWMVDMEGLVTENRSGIDPDTYLVARKRSECTCEGLTEGTSFSNVVQTVKPDIVLLLSAVRGLCSKQVIQTIKDSSSKRPAIFAMSNSQCSAQDIFATFGEDVVFASSVKFSNVNFGNGKIGYTNFANKLYLYPGIALGTRLSGAHKISDEMIYAAAKCLASMVKDEDVIKGVLYPPISSIRDISKKVAAAVVREAAKMGLSGGCGAIDAAGFANLSEEQALTCVEYHMWSP